MESEGAPLAHYGAHDVTPGAPAAVVPDVATGFGRSARALGDRSVRWYPQPCHGRGIWSITPPAWSLQP